VWQKLNEEDTPAVLHHFEFGPCTHLWENDTYLRSAIGDNRVSVQIGNKSFMDYKDKNFRMVRFEELLGESPDKDTMGSRQAEESFYFRSTSANRTVVSNFWKQWPGLAQDLGFPKFIPREKVFSSVLRVSSKSSVLFTHYDVMENVLLQIRGQKDVILFSPREVEKLYSLDGRQLLPDPRSYDAKRFMGVRKANSVRVRLCPGEALYIPAFWFHSVQALQFCMSVNVFWRRLPASEYDSKDMFGNRDLLAARRADEGISKAIRTLARLPPSFQDFYARRFIAKLKAKLMLADDERC